MNLFAYVLLVIMIAFLLFNRKGKKAFHNCLGKMGVLLSFFLLFSLGGYSQDIRNHGDVNNDGTVNVTDVVDLVDIIMKKSDANTNNPLANNNFSVKKVYGDGNTYCAFTSLIKRDGVYYLAFREAATHVSAGDYGVIRILKSLDGDKWEVFQTISLKDADLRDPNLSEMPNGKLLLICGARILSNSGSYETRTVFSKENEKGVFDDLRPVNIPEQFYWKTCSWVWKLTWYKGYGYGICYGDGNIVLLRTSDGINYELVQRLDISDNPTEACVQFKSDDTAIAMVRRNNNGYIGNAAFPYNEWNWKELDIYLAGQNFVLLDNNIYVVTRMTQNVGDRTVIWRGNVDGEFNSCYVLPYGGKSGHSDTAYAGIIVEDNQLLISYYAIENDGKPCVYIAKIKQSFY